MTIEILNKGRFELHFGPFELGYLKMHFKLNIYYSIMEFVNLKLTHLKTQIVLSWPLNEVMWSSEVFNKQTRHVIKNSHFCYYSFNIDFTLIEDLLF